MALIIVACDVVLNEIVPHSECFVSLLIERVLNNVLLLLTYKHPNVHTFHKFPF